MKIRCLEFRTVEGKEGATPYREIDGMKSILILMMGLVSFSCEESKPTQVTDAGLLFGVWKCDEFFTEILIFREDGTLESRVTLTPTTWINKTGVYGIEGDGKIKLHYLEVEFSRDLADWSAEDELGAFLYDCSLENRNSLIINGTKYKRQ